MGKIDKETIRIILDIVVIICLVIAIIIISIFLYEVLTEGGKCVINPLGYYLQTNNNNLSALYNYIGITPSYS